MTVWRWLSEGLRLHCRHVLEGLAHCPRSGASCDSAEPEALAGVQRPLSLGWRRASRVFKGAFAWNLLLLLAWLAWLNHDGNRARGRVAAAGPKEAGEEQGRPGMPTLLPP